MKLLFGWFAALPLLAFQPLVQRPAGLYFTAREYVAGQPGQPGTDAGTNLFSTKAALVNKPNAAEKCVSKVPLGAVWGYVERNGTAWRVFDGDTYRIEATDTLMVYSRLVSTGRSSYRRYYFSAGPAAPLAPFTRADLRRTFAGNARFLALPNGLRWYQSLQQWDNATHQTRAAALFHQSLPQ